MDDVEMADLTEEEKEMKRIISELQAHAISFVDATKDRVNLRRFCRAYFAYSVWLNVEVIKENPDLINEIVERTLILYELCLTEVVRELGGNGDKGKL